jgi:hypothetical protein
MAESVREYAISPHAALEMQRRGLEEAIVRQVLAAPEQREAVRTGRDARIEFEGRPCLVRVFVDVDRSPAEVGTVGTAYRTRKIEKYWRSEP